ncbi:hypothetical protein CL648_01595 [bacterium]|nr:hypothetical protein [bacterium]
MHDQFSITLIRPNQSRAVRVSISKFWGYSLGIGALVFSILLIALGIGVVQKWRSVQNYDALKVKYERQEQQVETLSLQLETLQSTVSSIIDTQSNLENMLPNRRQSYSKKKINYRIRAFNQDLQVPEGTPPIQTLEQQLGVLNTHIDRLVQHYVYVNAQFSNYQKRLDQIPSIWPVHGYIKSSFGFRSHPILGKRMFHYGVDIPSWLGTPVRATANGRVIAARYIKGLGLSVILEHGYGYKTIYAHASKLQVRANDRVRKGQVIANVGATGLVTAPSLHYEVWRYRKRIDPKPFLNLELFAAATNVW